MAYSTMLHQGHTAQWMVHQPRHNYHVSLHGSDPRKNILKCLETPCGKRCFVFIIALAFLSAVLFVGAKFLAGPGNLGHDSSGAEDFSLYTTVLLPGISGLFCDSYSVTKYRGGIPSRTVSLYLLDNKPRLSEEYKFSVYRAGTDMIELNQEESIHRWSFLLHTGSRYKVHSCVWEGGDQVELLVIRGKHDFHEWVSNYQHSKNTIIHSLSLCNSTEKRTPEWFPISQDGKYYFVYSASKVANLSSRVLVNMSFEKLEYSIDNTNISCQCSASNLYPEYYGCLQPCDIPLSFSGYVLITTSPTEQDQDTVSWEDTVYVTWTCDGSYNAYLLLYCVPLMAVFVLGLLAADLPKLLFFCKKSGNRVVSEPAESVPQTRSKMLIALLLFLCLLLVTMGCICAFLIVATFCLKIISLTISGDIPGLTDNNLKLGSLAAAAILFVISVLCNKCRLWVKNKVLSVAERVKQLRSSQMSRNKSIKIVKLTYLFYVIPIICIGVIAMSAFFTFLLGFLPILETYDSDIDSDIFLPGDSRTFSFNSFFCSGYSISSYGSSHLSATLHLVRPEFVELNYSVSFINTTASINENEVSTWNLYLNDYSGANVTVCIDSVEESQAMLSICYYDAFQTSCDSGPYIISNSCNMEIVTVMPIKERLKGSAGKYLLVLSTNCTEWIDVHIEILLDRSMPYVNGSVHNHNDTNLCSISSKTIDTCVATAPSRAGSVTGLITVHSEYNNQSLINWQETLSITKTCEYHWATWTALWLPLFLLNALFYLVCLGAFFRAVYKASIKNKKKKMENKISEEKQPFLSNSHTNRGYGSTVTASEPFAAE